MVNLAEAQRLALGVTAGARVLQFSALGFDAAVWEMATTLTVGATLCLLPPGPPPVGPELGRLIRDRRITNATLVPSVVPDIPIDLAAGLDTLVVAGEACPASLVDVWAPGRHLINAYGPTETTVCATLARCERDGRSPPIGRPLANVRTYVLDRDLNPVPIGVPGELHVGGVAVARGYLRRPELTRERFLRDPFAVDPDARMYRTGDLVRWRSSGELEFLGRRDHQVKVRGFRIELGEVEAALRSHTGVREAVVVAASDAGERRLVAYVVPDREGGTALAATAVDAHEASWELLYDAMLRDPVPADQVASTFTGWNSSYTGQPIADDEMRSWRDRTIERIVALRPDRVWEIGCGTGLVVLPLADRCRAYRGSDLSSSALAMLARAVDARGLSQVTLERRRADDFTGVEPGQVDTVIVNSVAQYFPHQEYLRDVVGGALRAVGARGAVFIGDVRSLPLLTAFRASVELARARVDLPAAELARSVDRSVANEPELVIDPELFRRLPADHPEIGHVEIAVKRGRHDNELEAFRYDVTLHLGPAHPAIAPDVSQTFAEVGGDLSTIRAWLETNRPAVAELLAVPNARVRSALWLVERLGTGAGTAAHVRDDLRRHREPAVHPEDLWELGEAIGYAVRITWSRTDRGCVDVLFERTPSIPPQPWLPPGSSVAADDRALASDPSRAARARDLVGRLHAFLDAKLPAYMVPADIVVLDELPLGPTGKVDRKALPSPAPARPAMRAGFEPPRTPLELALARAWEEALGIDRIGIHDDFWDLGGYSLLVSRVVFRVRDRTGIDLPLRALYEAPTIAGIAALVERSAAGPGDDVCFTPTLEMEREAHLDEAIGGRPVLAERRGTPDQIVLTGGTGFVGIHVLYELLAATRAEVHCLIRARDRSEAMARLRQSAAGHGLDPDAIAGRVHPVVGDLAADRLGLDATTFDRLAETADLIIHNGAKVDHVRGYATLKAANVGGTHEVLRLACARRTKAVHFISTLGVVYPPRYLSRGVVPADAPAGPLGELPNGYMQSKCGAEQLVAVARSRGVPAMIHRLGAVTGHSVTGQCNPGDYTYSALRAAAALGFADDLDVDLTLTPVDFAARAIAALSLQPPAQAPATAIHVIPPRPFSWLELVAALRDAGYPIETVSYGECMRRLFDAARAGLDVPILAFLPFLTQRISGSKQYLLETYHVPVRWDCEETVAVLAGLGVAPPPPAPRLIETYLTYLQTHAQLPPPRRGGR